MSSRERLPEGLVYRDGGGAGKRPGFENARARDRPRLFPHLSAFSETPPGRPWLRLFLVSFAVNAFLASGFVFPPHPLTGDEPHYLLFTKSLIDDGDINLFNNTAREDHRRFYPGAMESHAKLGRGGPGTLYSRHLPGLSILLVPFYALADRMDSLSAFVFIVRLPICLLTALLGAAFFLFALDLTGSRRAATAAWCMFSFTAPVFFYSSLIYPEIPAALITLLVFRPLFLRREASPFVLLLAGAGIGLLPWLSAKYAVLSILLFILAAAPRLKKSRSSRREFMRFSAAPLVLGLLFLFFPRSTYGHFNPVAVYMGAATPQTLSAGLLWKAANVCEFVSAGRTLQAERRPFVPYLADRRVRDNRSLGIFVEISASMAKSRPGP